MENNDEFRFSGAVDHLAVKSENLEADVKAYTRLGFTVESHFEDWAMVRDSKGFGIALLPSGSKHPPHIALRVDTKEELEAAAKKEGRPVKPHRDGTFSFYTKGVGGNIVELIWYPG
jgi:hypothetical protein